MRTLVLIAAISWLAPAQPPDPAYQPLTRAYSALRSSDYDAAIATFLSAIQAAPERPAIRKDLAYAYLKIGEPELARHQFQEAVRLDPNDTAAALEYAFLCYETKQQAEARRVFDHLRRTGNATAEEAFHNIDDPLAASIERWRKAIELGADNVSEHFELATLAEQRDDLALAAEHYERAWRLRPDNRKVLVELGRVWLHMGHIDEGYAALLAASRGGEPRSAEMARELLSARYPYVNEFRQALALDPGNHELRREFGYLLLRMSRESEAEAEFRILTENAPDDMLAATQLGFLLYARGERIGAQPLFDRVLGGPDEDLANRVRAVLRLPQTLRPRGPAAAQSIDAKIMAERSMKAGYMKDALKYLEAAHEEDPGDFDVVRKLGWTNNILHRDGVAVRWFDLARWSPDPTIAAEAEEGYRNLRGATQRFRFSAWMFPMFSTRWHDTFAYSQAKVTVNLGLLVEPYLSARFVGDTRRTIGALNPTYLSESSVIVAIGAATRPWHGITAWGEAGRSIGYIKAGMRPDYRGGLSATRTVQREGSAWLTETSLDALFISRFDNDFMVYSQSRAGYDFGPVQLHWNGNITVDVKRQDWANFIESGPGWRLPIAQSMYLTFNLLRGRYLINNPSRPRTFNDARAGLWYAFTH